MIEPEDRDGLFYAVLGIGLLTSFLLIVFRAMRD